MLHCAGYSDANYFFNGLSSIDYDIMAVSFYPLWHGKDLSSLKTALHNLTGSFNKPIVIAETAYPFSFGFNDFTNNIIGDNSQIISTYPATQQGQKDYLLQIKSIVNQNNRGLGFCYWGAEWISIYGPTATNGRYMAPRLPMVPVGKTRPCGTLIIKRFLLWKFLKIKPFFLCVSFIFYCCYQLLCPAAIKSKMKKMILHLPIPQILI